jgi:hypothetical protein
MKSDSDKPDPENAADRYSEQETARRQSLASDALDRERGAGRCSPWHTPSPCWF